MSFQVNEFLAGAGTDAPDVDEENIFSRPSVSYDDMWAKTLLETTEVDVSYAKFFSDYKSSSVQGSLHAYHKLIFHIYHELYAGR